MINKITKEKLEKYFSVTQQALDKAKLAFDEKRPSQAEDFFDMASRYFQDAQFFSQEKHDYVTAFAALNYAHGWLDAGARIGLFKVNDSRLFTVDDQ
ncbi:DUF357 domain-containing protein [Candidatus Woesearchaeota archaeon]|nr:DUF357 domain-containing protein [Candidatus Woesearchaeota archaeon]